MSDKERILNANGEGERIRQESLLTDTLLADTAHLLLGG